ncbi:periodic tryptophan protein 2-like protein [Senna tora]|uniref:Periodic tryptophan protein 2-like protein n=1 Tax=Senna tora TaxID=362788 RepID=A0A834X773_9FABA|nr:periodic tryptophan protein 2-like protein [Senna tora]
MLSCDEGDSDNDVFFDTADCLSSSSSPISYNEFEYEIWVNEPQSVKERRQRFLEGMGLSEMRNETSSLSNLSQNSILPGSSETSPSSSSDQAYHMFDEMQLCLKDEAEEAQEEEDGDFDDEGKKNEKEKKKKKRNWWWKRFVSKTRSKKSHNRIKVKQKKKRWIEFSGVYIGQEIKAHNGIIWTMKFSPNGKYLASGGEDGVVRIWSVLLQETSASSSSEEDNLVNEVKQDMFIQNSSIIVLPNKVFHIEESPLQELYGHTNDVLDLAWSNSESDILLSSSMDKTVRLWRIGCDQCLRVFHHNDYVTCIQVNPVDANYFISGSIDGKVRIWGLHEERVVDWADIHDVITAISYQPDGKGFLVGSLSGTCRFYVASGKHFELEAQIRVDGKKRSGGNKITSIQFSQEKHQRVLITSEDSKLRVLEGVDVVHKYKGLPKSGSQMSGSFTSNGSHMISVGQDSRVYIWNAAAASDTEETPSPKHAKSYRSCEYFSSEGVTVALPWSASMSTQHQMVKDIGFAHSCSEMHSERLPRANNWFSIDGTCSRGSMTWPEEKLPSWDYYSDEYLEQNLCPKDPWGLSIVTGSSDGTIRTFHNFGLPVRL